MWTIMFIVRLANYSLASRVYMYFYLSIYLSIYLASARKMQNLMVRFEMCWGDLKELKEEGKSERS